MNERARLTGVIARHYSCMFWAGGIQGLYGPVPGETIGL